jgi:hypothetical protein
MEQSILKSVKQAVGVSPDDPSFDIDLIMHINAEFSILNDLGVGAPGGFIIEDDTTEWLAYFPEDADPIKLQVMLSKVKSAVILRTRLLFDPPTQGFMLTSMQEQLKEMEWRLNANREDMDWVDPLVTDSDLVVVDGGDPAGE